MKPFVPFLLALTVLCSCNRQHPSSGAETSEALSGSPVNYSSRVGTVVKTATRTCFAIQNATLTPQIPLVIVLPLPPQTYFQAHIKGPSSSPCPLTQEVQPSLSSYEVDVTKGSISASPVIAVVANASVFRLVNDAVQSDLDQNGKMQTFRVCSSNDGVHLTMWSDHALEGKLIWHSYYYEESNPGMGPQCTPRELSGPQPQ